MKFEEFSQGDVSGKFFCRLLQWRHIRHCGRGWSRQEILQDKIFLDETSNVRITEEQEPAGGPPELDLESL